MRVMVLVKATADSEAGIMPDTEMFEAMGRFNEELVNAGVLLAGDGLKPSSAGKRVAFDGPSRAVTDGPFAETRELVAGFWLWEVGNLAEAVEWVKRCPNPMPGPSEIEIRPLYEVADFNEALTPELRELEQSLAGRVSEVAVRGRATREGQLSQLATRRLSVRNPPQYEPPAAPSRNGSFQEIVKAI